MCTCMVQETVSYFVHEKSNVYGLLLDASKAFDRVNYVKLFRIMLEKGVCPLICNLLLDMYVNQRIRLRWNDVYSDFFTVSNGVKQGGILSPCLFSVYIDGMLNALQEENIGCFMGGVYAGALAYADDLMLLSPSVSALRKMVNICQNYAQEYDFKFNGSKSQLIIFKCDGKKVINPLIEVNGNPVEVVDKICHLGHILSDDIFNVDVSKTSGDINRQCNMLLSNFKYASSHLRNILFQKYCYSFYGSQLYPLFDNSFDPLFRHWRVAVRRVWKVPWQTHSIYLPILSWRDVP